MTQLAELGDLIFEQAHPATAIMEELRKRLAKDFGVTVVGPYVTVRFAGKAVSMIVTSITDENHPVEPDLDDDK